MASVAACVDPQDLVNGLDTDNSQKPSASDATAGVNREVIDAQMDSLYLWNDSYRQTTRDFNQNYNDFLTDVLAQMLRKGVNRQDGYAYNGNWYFYTYIQREPANSTRAAKESTFGLGFNNIQPIVLDDSNRVYFMVEAVYPDSPASKAGFARGDIFGKVNGVQLTQSNFANYAYILYDEDVKAGDYSLSLINLTAGAITDGKTVNVKADNYLPTPIIFSRIYKIKGHTIGWIIYTGFESEYDDDLLALFDKFREHGVTDIVMDLRFNGGGHVESSRKIASILAGRDCIDEDGKGRVFSYERYNNERMSKRRRDPADYTTYEKRLFDTALAQRYGFRFDKIYVIGTSNTASASELLINSLRGIDKKVVLVGVENTNGKDVGMEIYSPVKAYAGYHYTLAPISFQSYNAKGESDYDDGFVPDLRPGLNYENYIVSPWGLSFDPEGKFIFNDYISDAVQAIVVDDVQRDDIEVIYTDDTTRAGLDTGLSAAHPATRALPLAPQRPKDPLKSNMYVVKEQ